LSVAVRTGSRGTFQAAPLPISSTTSAIRTIRSLCFRCRPHHSSKPLCRVTA
jgi:hypothetical protein